MGDEKVMTIRPDIEEFIRQLELHAGSKLNYPVETGELLQAAAQAGMRDEFEDLIFSAKFLVRTQEVMKRIGPGAEGFEKLSAEFQLHVHKSEDMLRSVLSKLPEDAAQKFRENFNLLQTDSFHRLMKLLFDLSRIKNWQIDGKLIPYEAANFIKAIAQNNPKINSTEKKQEEKSILPLLRIKKSAVLALVLAVLVLLLDPPVTISGWILSLGITVLLVYIILQIRHWIRL